MNTMNNYEYNEGIEFNGLMPKVMEADGVETIGASDFNAKLFENGHLGDGSLEVVDFFGTAFGGNGDDESEPNYLTFTAVEDNSSVGFWYWIGPAQGTCPDLGKNLEYSLDNGETWETYVIVNDYNNINWINLEHVGDSVMFRGNNETLAGTEVLQYTGCILQGKIAASGDITSLLNGKGGDIPVPDNCFSVFFFMSNALISAPKLPSKTLGKRCYSGMFYGCTSLNEVTCLATDISAEDCTIGWLDEVSQTGTFTKAAGMNDWTTGRNGIPEGWDVITAES